MRCWIVFSLLFVCACGNAPRASLDAKERATRQVKQYIADNLQSLIGAARDMQSSAPVARADGWQSPRDDAAISATQDHWRRARVHYERIEGAIAVLFANLDRAVDGRYENFLGEGDMTEARDRDLFNGRGVTGMHAIERILWSATTPVQVTEHERITLMHFGYAPPRYPANADEARGFRQGLVAQLVADLSQMEDDFVPQALDLPAAYEGVVGSMKEQREKLNYANTGEDESRYAQHTLADMRANLEGGRAVYDIFAPLICVEPNGDALHEEIVAHFEHLNEAYAKHDGDNVPPVPETWDMRNPSDADRMSSFGQLWERVFYESNENEAASLVSLMNAGGELLGLFE